VTSRVTRVLLRLVPPARRAWVLAAFVEAGFVDGDGPRRVWRRSSAVLLLKEAFVHRLQATAAALVCVGLIAWLDRSPSDDSGQFTLGAILLSAVMLGALAPRRAWLVAIVIGSVPAVVHIVSLALGLPEPGVHLPKGWANTTSLLVLIVPALIAAYSGSALRRLLASDEVPPTA
jgi:hypothetical protein